MLVSLNVKNFAIIDNIKLDFKEGKAGVLTGETGAGKSLIIDAIILLFGKRASPTGCATVKTRQRLKVFSGSNPKSRKSLGIELGEEDYLVSLSAKSTATAKAYAKSTTKPSRFRSLRRFRSDRRHPFAV